MNNIIKIIHPVKNPNFHNHKLVVKIENPSAGLHGFIAIFNDNLGPAVGGTRMYPYTSQKQALTDVLKLSEAMTYKCALAEVPHGGGKGVIIGDPKKDKTKKLLIAYAKEINKLKGKFYTGEDVGISEDDVQLMLKFSRYFIGKKGNAGDPSPYAGLSTYIAMKKAVSIVFKRNSLKDLRIAVKGVGKVGSSLLDLLIRNDAIVTIADIDSKAVKRALLKYKNIKVVDPKKIISEDVDIYAPCAMGNEFHARDVNRLRAKIVCGAANNQLATKNIGSRLHDKGIVYIPDYIANAGGVINVVDELEKNGYNKKRVLERINNIQNTVEKVIKLSKSMRLPINIVADLLAEKIYAKKFIFQ